MKFLLLLFSVCFAFGASAQEKKLSRLFGEDYKRVDAKGCYPFNEADSGVTIVPSNTFRDDTSGIVYNNEFVNFRFNRLKLAEELTYYHSHYDSTRNVTVLTSFDTIVPGTPVIRFVKEKPVSVAEYMEFQNWVRDSLARDELYLDETYLGDKEALNMLNVYLDLEDEDRLTAEYGEAFYDISDRYTNREMFSLNWKYPLKYDYYTRPEKTSLYIKRDEQFNRKIEFDQRKLNYRYTELTQLPLPESAPSRGHQNRMRYFATYLTPTLVDTYTWMNHAPRKNPYVDPDDMERKEWEALSQLYLEKFPDAPIIGITGMQARAYCDWKETQIRTNLMVEDLPYDVEVSLISVEDLQSLEPVAPFRIPEYNPTKNWQITVAEYKAFIKAVQDSVLNELLYESISDPVDVAQLVKYENLFSEKLLSSLAPVYFSKENKALNRKEFPLSYNRNIQKKYQLLVDSIRRTKLYQNLYFEYMYMDEYQRSLVGSLAEVNEPGILEGVSTDSMNYIGMDLNLGYENNRGQSSGVRSHRNLQTLYITTDISILPEIDWSSQQKDALVQGIRYSQALAFYNWKYPIWKATEKDNWLNYVVPTREEFEKVQRGGEIIVPVKEVAYPAPTFRYVVHLIPIEDEE